METPVSKFSTGGARRALIVDDSRPAAAMAAAMLEACGWEFDLALDGFEAISRLRHASYGAILLDYRLPGMDGVEVMEWIVRNIPAPPPVIVLSSDNRNFVTERFSGLGVKAVLTKPVAVNDLCEAIER
jgi:two-component system, sensor histidine kinase and response regulator